MATYLSLEKSMQSGIANINESPRRFELAKLAVMEQKKGCGLQRIVTMGALKLLIIFTQPQRKMATTAIKPCQYPVILHHLLSISDCGL